MGFRTKDLLFAAAFAAAFIMPATAVQIDSVETVAVVADVPTVLAAVIVDDSGTRAFVFDRNGESDAVFSVTACGWPYTPVIDDDRPRDGVLSFRLPLGCEYSILGHDVAAGASYWNSDPDGLGAITGVA